MISVENSSMENSYLELNNHTVGGFKFSTADQELFVQDKSINRIGKLDEYTSLRRLDISFNALTTLRGIEQFPQLRQLSAYCCRLKNCNAVENVTKLTSLMLQQNGITSIPSGFTDLKKLSDLRLDRNALNSSSNLRNLASCSSLKSLNLSYNKLTSLDGLMGLQSLSELKANNNQLTSLSGLRSLPSLIELEVSHNDISSLEGLQLLPTLEVLYADNNYIASVVIPHIYTHKGALDRNPSASNKLENTKKRQLTGNASLKEKKLAAEMRDKKQADGAVMGMPNLKDVFLHNNQITSLDGFDTFGNGIELLDLQHNQLGGRNIELLDVKQGCQEVGKALSSLKFLEEVRLHGNPCFPMLRPPPALTNNIENTMVLADMGQKSDQLIPLGSDSSTAEFSCHTNEVLSYLAEVFSLEGMPSLRCVDQYPLNANEMLTYGADEDDESIFDDNDTATSETKGNDSVKHCKLNPTHAKKMDDVSLSDKTESASQNHSGGPMAPVLVLKDMLSQKDILRIENLYRSIVSESKHKLSSVFEIEKDENKIAKEQKEAYEDATETLLETVEKQYAEDKKIENLPAVPSKKDSLSSPEPSIKPIPIISPTEPIKFDFVMPPQFPAQASLQRRPISATKVVVAQKSPRVQPPTAGNRPISSQQLTAEKHKSPRAALETEHSEEVLSPVSLRTARNTKNNAGGLDARTKRWVHSTSTNQLTKDRPSSASKTTTPLPSPTKEKENKSAHASSPLSVGIEKSTVSPLDKTLAPSPVRISLRPLSQPQPAVEPAHSSPATKDVKVPMLSRKSVGSNSAYALGTGPDGGDVGGLHRTYGLDSSDSLRRKSNPDIGDLMKSEAEAVDEGPLARKSLNSLNNSLKSFKVPDQVRDIMSTTEDLEMLLLTPREKDTSLYHQLLVNEYVDDDEDDEDDGDAGEELYA